MRIFDIINKLRAENKSSIVSLYTSLFGMLICIICLSGTTWAWFTGNQTATIANISSADRIISVMSVTRCADGETGDVDVFGGSFLAEANVLYSVRVTVDGSANSGYILVRTCDGDFYTEEESCGFGLLLSEECEVDIYASWGSYNGQAMAFESGVTLGDGKEPDEPVAQAYSADSESEGADADTEVKGNDVETEKIADAEEHGGETKTEDNVKQEDNETKAEETVTDEAEEIIPEPEPETEPEPEPEPLAEVPDVADDGDELETEE